jgi:hypothetical protein
MPATYSDEQRQRILEKVMTGLRAGTPLAVLCSDDGMPCDDTVRNWADSDATLARDIARAREAGFDQIALDALAIADDSRRDTKRGKDGQEVPDSEWITRSRLRVETRLKLLAKWDPKRYGERVTHAGDADNPVAFQEIRRTVIDPAAR